MSAPRQTTNAFTLLELLIVLALLSLLVVVLAAAMSPYINTGQTMATEATIRKVYTKLQTQWGTVIREAITESASESVMNAHIGVTKNTGVAFTDFVKAQVGNDPRRLQVIYIKARLMQEFPENFDEATSFSLGAVQFGIWQNSNFAPTESYLSLAGITKPLIGGPQYESSACLLAALQRARHGTFLSADDLGSSIKTFTDSNGKAVQAIVDGWGNPIQFSRWPTGNADVDALYPGVSGNIVRDPQDTDGTLMNNVWWASYHGVFESWLHSIHQGTSPNVTPYAYYTMPVIASAGTNGLLGMNLPDMSLDGTGNDTDNIYSYRLLSPGSRGN